MRSRAAPSRVLLVFLPLATAGGLAAQPGPWALTNARIETVSRGVIEASEPELLTAPLPAGAERLYVSDNHMRNFFDCLRTRELPICDAEIGHRSVSVCHLGVIAMRLGRKLAWDPKAERFTGDDEANQHLAREMRKPWTYDSV